MVHNLTLRLKPETAYDSTRLRIYISTILNIDVNTISDIVIAKRSIDARQKQVMINLTVNVYVGEKAPENPIGMKIDYPDVSGKQTVTIVGAGPAGLFAALRLIELGLRPIVIERGKDVDSRRVDMAKIARENIVNPDSNYCFGEGGAGAYSDGKLYTRSKKRGNVEKILSVFHNHGASQDILVDAHPHIGTDKLPVVIKAMRNTIIRCGGEVRFNTRMDDIII